MDNYENNQNNQGYTPENNEQPQQPYQAQPQQPYQEQPQQTYQAQPQQYNTQQTYEAQPQQTYQAQPYQAPQEKDKKAIASLVLGIVSILCCNPLFAASIVGIIMGVQSRKANPENNTMAMVGIILSVVGIVFGIIGTIVAIVMFINGQNSTTYTYHYGYY